MGINKSFIVDAGLIVGTTANVATSLAVGSNVVVNTTTISISGAVVNSTYFSGTANNSVYFNGNGPEYYTNATNLSTGTIPYARIPVNVTNTTASFTLTGNWTFNSNVSISADKVLTLGSNSGISANGSLGQSGYTLKTNGTSIYWAVDEQGVTSVTGSNGISGSISTTGSLSAVGANGIIVNSSGIGVRVGNNQVIANSSGVWIDQSKIDHNATTNYNADQHVAHSGVSISAGNGLSGGGSIDVSRSLAVNPGTGIVANTTGVHVNSSYIATLTSNNATNFAGQAASYYTNIPARLGYTPMNVAGGTFTGAITVPSSLTINAEGSEGGQMILKKGSGMTTTGDVYVDAISSGLRIYDNNGTSFPSFLFNLASGTLTSSFGTFWHTGNDGAGSGLDADLLDGADSSYFTNIPARLGYTPLNKGGDSMTGNLTMANVHTGERQIVFQRSGQNAYFYGNGSEVGMYDSQYGSVWSWGYGGSVNLRGALAWTAANDGSGSGMDADLVDGWHRDDLRQWGNLLNKPFNWSGQPGQPSWLWGSNDGTNYYVWNPSNFSVNYSNSSGYAGSAGSASSASVADNALGYNQQWYTMSMSPSTVYQNTWGRPVQISFELNGEFNYYEVSHDSVNWVRLGRGHYLGRCQITVPPGHYWRTVGGSILYAAVLR